MKGTCLSSKQEESVHENNVLSNIIHTEKETDLEVPLQISLNII